MFLTGPQAAELSGAISAQLSPASLDMLASDLGINLGALGPAASLKEQALKLIDELGKSIPPRHDDLLLKLSQHKNTTLRALAQGFLRPAYFPPGSAMDAILLGPKAFVARDDLRRHLLDFIEPTPFTNRVLFIKGTVPGGKSYSWEFLRHMALQEGVQALRLRLQGTSYTPGEFIVQIYSLLRLDRSTLPVRYDDPQLAKVDHLINDFKGKIPYLARRYWLVIDDLNEPSVTPDIRECAFAIARAVEEAKSDNLCAVFLGYNEDVIDPELRYVPAEDAEYPNSRLVARHLKKIADSSPSPISQALADQIAQGLFNKFPTLNKDAMYQLTLLVEQAGRQLQRGVTP